MKERDVRTAGGIPPMSNSQVLSGIRVVEQGTHLELMGMRGRYRELVSLQSLEKHR